MEERNLFSISFVRFTASFVTLQYNASEEIMMWNNTPIPDALANYKHKKADCIAIAYVGF